MLCFLYILWLGPSHVRAPDLAHPPVSLSMAQTAPHFAPSVQSHSTASGHGWISDPLPPTSQDSTTHQPQVGGMSTTVSTPLAGDNT